MRRKGISLRRIAVLLAVIACALCLFSSSFAVLASEPFELHVIDVGEGLSVLIESEGHYMLIDGGGRYTSSSMISYLKEQGIEQLDCVAATHYDADHIAGVIGVLNVFPCDLLLLPDYKGSGDLYQSLAVAAISNGCMIMHGYLGMEIPIGDAVGEIIGPVRDDYPAENDMSLCFSIGYGDKHFLVCGDAEQSSELDLVSYGVDLSADVYVVNHHGSSTSSMDEFLDAVDPEYAIISCGRDNDYGHPTMETLQRLQNHGVSMYRTDEQGTIIVGSDGYDIWFNKDSSDDWNAGVAAIVPLDTSSTADDIITREGDGESGDYRYVCNTNTKKFHYPECDSVKQMNDENRLYTSLTRDELLAEGYKPCGNCKP